MSDITQSYLDLESAFNSIGCSMMGISLAIKLLAWVSVYGGNNSAVVLNGGLNAGIRLAQKKFNLYGGCVPKLDLIEFNSRVIELREQGSKTPWLVELTKRYGDDILLGV